MKRAKVNQNIDLATYNGVWVIAEQREGQVQKVTLELLGEGKAFSVAQLNSMGGGQKSSKSAGSEDFAYVSQKVPSVMFALAAGQPDKGYVYPQHHPMVKFDEDALPIGSALYAYTALRWLEEHR